jgi:hypothetical protein
VVSYEAVAAANDAMFVNTGEELVLIKNASGSSVNIVVETPMTVLSEGLAVADEACTALANGAEGLYGPFPTVAFNQPSGADVGKVYINVDQAVTIAVVKAGSLS